MRRSSKPVARIPEYWFGWYPKSKSTEFYIKVYWEIRRRGIRKSNKTKVLEVMRQVDFCDTSVTHNMTTFIQGDTHMDNITNEIVSNQLEQLGVQSKPEPAPAPEVVHVQDELDIPPFLDRRTEIAPRKPDTRGKQWQPTTQRNQPESWAHDSVLAKLDEIRKESWECTGPDAVIDKGDFDNMVGILATDLGNALEQAGLFYANGGQSTQRLRDLIAEYVASETKYGNGSMYRFVVVSTTNPVGKPDAKTKTNAG